MGGPSYPCGLTFGPVSTEEEPTNRPDPTSPFSLPLAPGLVLWFAIGLALMLQPATQRLAAMVAEALGAPTLEQAMQPGKLEDGLLAVKLQLAAVQLFTFGLLGAFFMGVGQLWRPQPGGLPRRLAYQALLAMGILVLAAPAMNLFMLDEQSFSLPEGWKDLEYSLQKAEARLANLFEQLLGQHPLMNLLVVALVPAVCEELFFRGALQRSLQRLLPGHGAVWLTGLLFSLLHFQPYGFVPRLLLGVVLGYLAWGSGRLLPAMAAHFANNAMVVVGGYLVAQGSLPTQALDPEYQPPLGIALGGLAAAAALGVVYWRLRSVLAPNA